MIERSIIYYYYIVIYYYYIVIVIVINLLTEKPEKAGIKKKKGIHILYSSTNIKDT
jgi:hypothetical protein